MYTSPSSVQCISSLIPCLTSQRLQQGYIEAHRKGSQLPAELEQDLTSSLWADAGWAYGAGLDLSGVH